MDTARLQQQLDLSRQSEGSWRRTAEKVMKECYEARDTIERLQGLNIDLDLLAKKRATLLEQATAERDAARAEVERLKGEIADLEHDQRAEDQATYDAGIRDGLMRRSGR